MIRAEQGTKLLQISQERSRLVVIHKTAEGVQSRLAIAKEPILFKSLSRRDVCLAHNDAAIAGSREVLALNQLVCRSVPARGVESGWHAVAVQVWSHSRISTFRAQKIVAV